MAIKIINNSIFTTGVKYIAHQNNCVSQYSKGLAKDIFEKYPYANCYMGRREYDSTTYSEPGTIQVCGDGLEQRGIINMFSQYYPGKATETIDTIKDRKKWFFNCLMKIAEIENLHSVAFPDHIGCGLAGGDWEWYFKRLVDFSNYVEKKAVVLIYENITSVL